MEQQQQQYGDVAGMRPIQPMLCSRCSLLGRTHLRIHATSIMNIRSFCCSSPVLSTDPIHIDTDSDWSDYSDILHFRV